MLSHSELAAEERCTHKPLAWNYNPDDGDVVKLRFQIWQIHMLPGLLTPGGGAWMANVSLKSLQWPDSLVMTWFGGVKLWTYGERTSLFCFRQIPYKWHRDNARKREKSPQMKTAYWKCLLASVYRSRRCSKLPAIRFTSARQMFLIKEIK